MSNIFFITGLTYVEEHYNEAKIIHSRGLHSEWDSKCVKSHNMQDKNILSHSLLIGVNYP